MPLTFGQARKILAPFASKGGKCASSEDVAFFVREVLEYMLYSGASGNNTLRKFCFKVENGCFTVPYELETPLKVKIEGKLSTVWDKWFEWHSGSNLQNCVEACDALSEEPNYFPVAYDLPSCGARVAALGTCTEDEDAHIIVQGVDTTGREIYTKHDGETISGEYLRIRKGELRYSQVTFGKINSIVKSKTNGYVQLNWIIPESNKKGFLADYSPLEEAPSYRRFKLKSGLCSDTVRLTVLGRVRLRAAYTDNDYIPFDTVYSISLAGQAINSNFNDNVEIAAAKDATLQTVIERENSFKKVNVGSPVEIYQKTSGGAIKNII